MIIDTHCHLDFYPNPLEFALKYENSGYTIIGVTNLPSYFEQGVAFLRSFKRIRLALGLHPLETDRHTKTEIRKFQTLADTTSFIGEVGLDFSREGINSKTKQLRSFELAMETISGTNKLVSLHSRRAEKEVYEILCRYEIRNAIFHWYSGPLGLINDIVDAGYFFSINPAMVNSVNGQRVVNAIPRLKILTETDGPYVQIGGRTVLPEDIGLVHDYIGKLHGISAAESMKLIKQNFSSIISAISKK